MEDIFDSLIGLYYNYCNTYNQDYFERKKQDDDFKIKNHEEIRKVVEDHPLAVLRRMSADEIDQLAYKFSILLKGSYHLYPASKENQIELDLVEKQISKSDYPLAQRFRKSFENYVRDLYYTRSRDNSETNGYLLLRHVYITYRHLN